MWRPGEERLPEFEKQKEYQRQQERLRALNTNYQKPAVLSADMMIEGLLKNKETFKKVSSQVAQQNISPVFCFEDFPSWLNPNSSMVPTLYKTIWNLVQLPVLSASEPQVSETRKVSQILLTSNLPTDVLGFIWNMANKTIAGQLTQFELYIVLALVALAQNGCTFNNLSVLNLIPSAPIPVLNLSVLESSNIPSQPLPKPANKKSLGDPKSSDFYELQSTVLPSQNYINVQSEISASKVFGSSQNISNVISSNLVRSKNEAHIRPVEDKVIQKNVYLNKGDNINFTVSDLSKQKINQVATNFVVEPAKSVTRNSFPCIGSSPTAELETNDDDFTEFQSSMPKREIETVKPSVEKTNSSIISETLDDFTDFQSAIVPDRFIEKDPLETVVISQKRDISKITLPKLPSFKAKPLKISPESEKRLKCIAPAESLSNLPESKISTDNKVLTMPNIAVLGGSREVGSRLANHTLESRNDKPKHCHRHHKNKSSPVTPVAPISIDELFSKSRTLLSNNIEELFPRCKNNNFILKETKIRNDQTYVESNEVLMSHEEQTRQIEIPCLGIISETLLPSQKSVETQEKIPKSGVELMLVEEDKYSALRDISLETNEGLITEPAKGEESFDDFGDFLSADVTGTKDREDDWGDWKSPELHVESVNNTEKDTAGLKISMTELNVDNSLLETNVTLLDLQSVASNSSYIPTSGENLNVHKFDFSLDLVSSTLDFDTFKEGPKDKNETLDYLSTPTLNSPLPHISTSESINKLPNMFDNLYIENDTDKWNDLNNVKINLENIDVSVNWESPEAKFGSTDTDKNEDFGDFIGPSYIQKIPDHLDQNLSRHSSLPSLDLKISPADEGMTQDRIARKCLDCCLSLLQDGVDTFRNVSSEQVLEEVFYTQEAQNYLKHLNIVYYISRRVSQYKSELDDLHNDIDRIWSSLEKFSEIYDLKLDSDPEIESSLSDGRECSVCCHKIIADCVEQGDFSYHPTCANLWVNCIEYSLPCPI